MLAASWVGLALTRHKNSICLSVFPSLAHLRSCLLIPFSRASPSLWDAGGDVRVQRCISLSCCRMTLGFRCSFVLFTHSTALMEPFAGRLCLASCFLALSWNNAWEREALFSNLGWEERRWVKVWLSLVSDLSWIHMKFDIQLLTPRTKSPVFLTE